jgi:hypothetical protein
LERDSEALARVVVAGGLVGSHRDPAPLLQLVEAPLYDVAAPVPLTLLIAEVDRPARPLAAVSDLVVAFWDCRGDATLA